MSYPYNIADIIATVKPLISTTPISRVPINHSQESLPNPKSPLLGFGGRPVFTPVNLKK